jgi:NAD(P)-dependent dehydrogenase (short-subunit alcohol dehydrogenase family)
MSTRQAVVTGAASGIGRATVDALRWRGWDVAGLDIAVGRDSEIIPVDVSNEASLRRVAAGLSLQMLNALVCCAAIWAHDDDRFSAVSSDAWASTWSVNVTGTMNSLRVFVPSMVSGASIVTLGSVVSLVGMPRRDAYTASKGAIVALTRAWAADLIRDGIRVNCVCPGVTATPMTKDELIRTGDNLPLPLGRPASAREIADVICLCLDATYLNGAVIPVDGGWTSTSLATPITPRIQNSG